YGSVVFGLAVVAVHYTAMLGTSFRIDESFEPVPVVMANHSLAITVTVAAFVICGTFLLAATTFLTHSAGSSVSPASAEQINTPAAAAGVDMTGQTAPTVSLSELNIPFEKNKKIDFLSSRRVAAIRADGHYTHLYTKDGVLFCPWSITKAETELGEHNFHRTHRSYLVNIDAIDTFEKRKETGACLFTGYPQLSSVPVSRNRIIGLTAVLDGQQSTDTAGSLQVSGG
ncbi:MAG: LytTR family transcriptional regulator DNA-binding domain-containing protein, partial [Pseudomonadota bacterium]